MKSSRHHRLRAARTTRNEMRLMHEQRRARGLCCVRVLRSKATSSAPTQKERRTGEEWENGCEASTSEEEAQTAQTQHLHAVSVAETSTSSVSPLSSKSPLATSSQPAASRIKPLPVRINGAWYDLGVWASSHPAGRHWIHMYEMRDATDVFHAFHSERASFIISRMRPMKAPPMGADEVPAPTPLQEDFRALRRELHEQGWFSRDWLQEGLQLASYALLLGSAVAMAHCGTEWLRALAFMPLGCSHCYVGWLAHDYVHGRGRFCAALRNIGGWGAGFSASMWSDKHNTHHAMTNFVGVDEDLSGGPLLWLWSPDPSRDRSWRRFQHIYAGVLFSLLHVIWRIDSVKVTLRRRLWSELLPIVAHYFVWFSVFSVPTVMFAVLFGGLLMANITSTTHQSEDLMYEYEHDWIKVQLTTTRNARCLSAFSEWIWGGMQYQIEHHLFPTMPRYRYPSLVPKIRALAERHGLEYRESDEFAIIAANYRTYARIAREPAHAGAPASSQGLTL